MAKDRPIRWGYCGCFVWALDPRLPAGRCRRCDVKPYAGYTDEETARDAFFREYGRTPVEFVLR